MQARPVRIRPDDSVEIDGVRLTVLGVRGNTVSYVHETIDTMSIHYGQVVIREVPADTWLGLWLNRLEEA